MTTDSKPNTLQQLDDILKTVAAEHSFSQDAVAALHTALLKGGGTMAQFHHPELGGNGQWMNNGMVMIGDMFNNALKARVDALAKALLPHLDFPSNAQTGGSASWWPAKYSAPASTGGQNDSRYAYFPQDNALVVEEKGQITVYDTTGHVLSGFGQQQSSTSGFHVSSAKGSIAVSDLPKKD